MGAKAMFPGEDYVDQLKLITSLLGSPSDDDLAFITSDLAKNFMRKLPPRDRVPLSAKYPAASAEAIDLLSKMLCFNPHHRITAEEALQHPFLAAFKGRGDESLAPKMFSFEFEKQATSVTALKTLFLKEVRACLRACVCVCPSAPSDVCVCPPVRADRAVPPRDVGVPSPEVIRPVRSA